ncbi:formate/nitrite transporter family protein [Cribrihabitans sp. XS_ASV171]
MSDLQNGDRNAASGTEGTAGEPLPGPDDQSISALTDAQRSDVTEHRRLSALTVYSIILNEGEEELSRPVRSLVWSGIAAGICICASLLAEGLLHSKLGDHPYRGLIENMGYTVGFILVILSRLQLFTENTIAVVLPVLYHRTGRALWRAARLWGVVLAANLLGVAVTMTMALWPGTVDVTTVEGMTAVSRDYASLSGLEPLWRAIPAGFFVATIVWMLPSAKGFEIFVIFVFTYLLAVGHFPHIVAGFSEVFLLLLVGELELGRAVFGLVIPTLVGNIIGGTGLFALLAHAQVQQEM